MIDLLHLPEPSERVAWFPGQGVSTDTTGWRVWNKPRGVSMVAMLLISSGGGGGGGDNGLFASATAWAGGGGGSSGISRYLFPAWALPDKLYVLSRAGGVGGRGGQGTATGSTQATNGTAGGLSYVAVYPSTVAGNLMGVSGAAAPGGALSGRGAATGGTAGTVAAITSAPLGQMALTQIFSAGLVGSTGSSTAGTSLTPSTSLILPGPAGGGASSLSPPTVFNGGGYNAVANTLLGPVSGGVLDSTGQASSGFISNGYYYGGVGGGASKSATDDAQSGGHGAVWGAGGGGGGATTTTTLRAGNGGDCGPGLVIIASW